jgi:peptidoglycan/LPS O-acetylase OafA/YrhL
MVRDMVAGGAAAGETRIDALDGVRALAVIGVIASHSGLVGLGWIGVDIFFGLSGYLITGILLDARRAAPTARQFFVPFYMRRSLRILPLAWAVALIMAAVRGEWSGLLWYMGYLVNWLPASPPPVDLGHYWSLAVEEQFYLVWPAIVFFSSSRTLWRVSWGVIAFDIACRFGVSMWPPDFATAQFQGLATYARADTLAIGALLAQRQRSGGWGSEVRWAIPAGVAATAGLLGLRLLERMALMPLLTYNLKWPVLTLGVGAGLLYVLTRPPQMLQWRWMVWIGKISYGIYVIHACFGDLLHDRFDSAPVVFALQLALTIPLAALSWYLFEEPILRRKRSWPMPARRPVGAPAPAVFGVAEGL